MSHSVAFAAAFQLADAQSQIPGDTGGGLACNGRGMCQKNSFPGLQVMHLSFQLGDLGLERLDVVGILTLGLGKPEELLGIAEDSRAFGL